MSDELREFELDLFEQVAGRVADRAVEKETQAFAYEGVAIVRALREARAEVERLTWQRHEAARLLTDEHRVHHSAACCRGADLCRIGLFLASLDTDDEDYRAAATAAWSRADTDGEVQP